MQSLCNQLESVSRSATQAVAPYSAIIKQLCRTELAVARARSLHLKFACDEENNGSAEVKMFVKNLMCQPEVDVIGAARGPVGKTICKLFQDAQVSDLAQELCMVLLWSSKLEALQIHGMIVPTVENSMVFVEHA